MLNDKIALMLMTHQFKQCLRCYAYEKAMIDQTPRIIALLLS